MSKRLIKDKRENVEKHFLDLVRAGSAKEIKIFYSYFKSDLNKLFEENLNKENSVNPLKAAFSRGDPEIFCAFILLQPNFYSKNQNNDRALKYAIQLNSVESGKILLLTRQTKELSVGQTSNPHFNSLLSDFQQLSKDEFALKYSTVEEPSQVSFPFTDLPVELQCHVLNKLSIGCTFTARAVCKFWHESIRPHPIKDNYFIKWKMFECETTAEEYYLKVELHPTVHHFCLSNPRRILQIIEPKDYDSAFLDLVDDLVNTAAADCDMDPSRKEELRDLILNTEIEELYYWEGYGCTSIYLKIEDDAGIGITLQEPVEGNFKPQFKDLKTF